MDGDGVRRRNPYVDEYGENFAPSTSGMHRPGKPIGYFAARGTPYGKKIFGKKMILFIFILLPVLAVINLAIVLLPVLLAIANHTLSVTVMHVTASNITDPHNDYFPLTLEGQVKKAGVFPAHLYFREPVVVKWMTPPESGEMREVELGNFRLDYIGVAAGHGRIKQVTKFNIQDQEMFGLFTQFMITNEEFTWRLFCPNVHVEAFSFLPTYENLKLTKDVVFNGINNFKDVKILDFQLPSADPEGGISFYAKTALTNPSPFGFQLGTLNIELYNEGLLLGPGFSTNVNITPGVNIIDLKGRLLSYSTNQSALNQLGNVFTNFINGEVTPTYAQGKSVVLSNGQTVGWLSKGIQALNIYVPFQSPYLINPIKSIVIKQFNLTYESDSDPYSPTASSDSLSADLALPFGFPLNIISAKNEITIVDQINGKPIVHVAGVYSNSETQLNVVASGQTAGTLFLTLRPSPMILPSQTDDARAEFDQFQKEFTFSTKDPKKFNGSSAALTDTPVGRILLNGIKFSVDSGLLGLQGLAGYPTTINGVDVVGGSREALTLSVNTTIINPSNVNVKVGTTKLLMVYSDVVGDVVLNDLNLVIGENNLTATSNFNPKASPKGYELLNRYISGLNSPVNISGYDDSTGIKSLVPAFSAVRVNSTLNGLKTQLVGQAQLKVLNTTGIQDDVANSIVSLNNPFTSGLKITNIKSNVTSHGLFVASIDTDLDFSAGGKATTNSPAIPLHLNLYPPDIFALVRALAVQSGQDVKQLDGIVELAGYTYSKTTNANNDIKPSKRSLREEELEAEQEAEMVQAHLLSKRKTNMYTGFNLVNFVQKAFSVASANLEIVSMTQIGEYESALTFSQQNVPLKTDDSLNLLLPVLSKPIVQKIIDGATLGIDKITIIDPQLKSFKTQLVGSITNSGPFDAKISFPQGLQVSWNNKVLGQIAMPQISLAADEGAQLNLQADFAVADVDALTEFTKFLVTQPSFVWQIAGQGLQVDALGISVGGMTINKGVILTGMNNLKNAVTVQSYDLPSNDPAGGIHLTAQSVITNPSQIGVQLSRFGTMVYRNGTNLGPVAAAGPFTLLPLSKTNLPLAGRLQHQDSAHGLATLSQTFTDVVHGKEIPVEIRGDYAGPSSVTWLNEGIKLLVVQTKLPAVHFSVIKAISLNQMTLMFTEKTAWNPATSSSNTQAPFYLPFGFPLDIQNAGGDFIEGYKGTDIAILKVPMSPAVTDVQARIMTLKFNDVPMQAYSDKHSQFSGFLADTTAQKSVTFQLHGSADAKANTAAGLVTITDIPFGVSTTLDGLQNLNARPVVTSDLDVAHGYSSYLLITLKAAMYNPSHITIGTGDVSFTLQFQGHNIGTAQVKNLILKPGMNNVSTDVHYSPQGSANEAAGQKMLENYVQGIESTAVIQGSRDTTPIASLKQALSGIRLATQIPPLHQLLIIETRLVIPKNIAQTSTAQATFQLRNPFTASINLVKVKAKALYQGIYLGVIDQNLNPPIRAPGHATITSRTLPLKMDLDPKNLIRFIEKAAANTNTNLGPLTGQFDKVMAMSSTKTTVQPYPDDNPPNCHSGRQFDVFGAVLSLLKGLEVTLDIQSITKLDDYQTPLNIIQQPVPTDTDRTSLYLIGPVGAPIVQNIVDEATLSFSVTNITNVRNDGFDLSLQGQLLKTGPFDAQIEFPEGVTVTWQGQDIAQIQLPPICAQADIGVPNLRTNGKLKITNQGGFTKFATYILHNPSFVWTIHTNKLRVRALNIIFNDVKISKDLNFKAFNGLKGVKITSFDIPGETSNALKVTTGTDIPSPASLGIQLDTSNFKIYFNGQYMGPIHSTNLFLAAATTTHTTLNGFLTQMKSDAQVKAAGQLFSQYLQGKGSDLEIKGDSVVTRANGNKPVSWLTAAFKTLTLDVVLPGHIYKIVLNIIISDLFVTLMTQSQTWAPPTGSNQSIAMYANPLHFSLTPLKASLDGTMIFNNQDAAVLKLPLRKVSPGTGTSHGPQDRQPLVLSWNNVPLKALSHSAFQAMFAQLTDFPRADIGLKGTVGLVARMVIGDIPIEGIPFGNLTTPLKGFDSFTHKAVVQRLDVYKGTPEYLDNKMKLIMTNPSNVTIKTTGLSLPAFYKDTYVGRALLDDKTVVPGDNYLEGIFRYQPNNKNDSTAQEVIQRYAQPQEHNGKKNIPYQTPATLKGIPNANPPLTPFESLRPAIEGVYVTSSLPGIATRVLQRIDAFFDVLTLFSAPGLRPYIFIKLTFQNDMPVPVTFTRIQDEANIAGQPQPIYASSTENHVTNCRIPASRATKVDPGVHTCDPIHNVLGVQGLLGSLPVIEKNLDVANMVQIQLSDGGYVLNGLQFNEYDVDTTYSLAIGGVPLLNITSIDDMIQGILGSLGKMSSDDVSKVTNSFASLGENGIGQLADTNWNKVVCALENLPLSLIHTAKCQSNTPAGKVAAKSASSSSSSMSSTSNAGASSSKVSVAPNSSGAKSSGGNSAQNQGKSSQAAQTTKAQSQAKSSAAPKSSSSSKGGLLGGIFG